MEEDSNRAVKLPDNVTVLEGPDMPEPTGYGYKATDGDMSCRDMTYEIGKWYKWKGTVSLCESGFHFCKRVSDCFNYYPFSGARTRIFSVQVSGVVEPSGLKVPDGDEEGDTKCVAEKIRLVKELSADEISALANSGRGNKGIHNKGNDNQGSYNNGDRNAGNRNNGSDNIGDYNNGSRNSGSYNEGSDNIGNGNKGDKNVGNGNLGACNFGNSNIGSFNRCNNALGYLNTESRPFLVFDKPTDKQASEIVIPDFMKSIGPVQGIHMDPDDMGNGDPMGWRRAVEHAQTSLDGKWKQELDKLLNIPNFDYEKFRKISGLSREDLENPPKPTLHEIGPHLLDSLSRMLFDMRMSDTLSIGRYCRFGDSFDFAKWVRTAADDLIRLGSLGVYWGGVFSGVMGMLDLRKPKTDEVMDRWFGVGTDFRKAMDSRRDSVFIPFCWLHPAMWDYSYLPHLFHELLKLPGKYVMATSPNSEEFMTARGFTKTKELKFPDNRDGVLWQRNNTPQFITYKVCFGYDVWETVDDGPKVVGVVPDLGLYVEGRTKLDVVRLILEGVRADISRRLSEGTRLPIPTDNRMGDRLFGESRGIKHIDAVENVTTDLWSTGLDTRMTEKGEIDNG